MIIPIAAACLGGAAFNVAVDLIGNWLSGRKSTLGGLLVSAATGCIAGLIGLGAGKVINEVWDVAREWWQAMRVVDPVASQIANGHALLKHLAEFPELLGRATPQAFAKLVDSAIGDATASGMIRNLSGGRVAYWSAKLRMVVIYNPNSVDGGTAFRPIDGIAYFLGLK